MVAYNVDFCKLFSSLQKIAEHNISGDNIHLFPYY